MPFIFTPNSLSSPVPLPHFPSLSPSPHHHRRLKPRPTFQFPSKSIPFPLHLSSPRFSSLPISSSHHKPLKSPSNLVPHGTHNGLEGDGVVEGKNEVVGFDWCEILRPVVFVVFWVVVGLAPIRRFQAPATALPSISGLIWRKKKEKKEEVPRVALEHEYSRYTRVLMEEVSKVLNMMKEVRESKREVKDVEKALKEVKRRKKELQEQIMSGISRELRGLYRENEVLVEAADDVLVKFDNARNEEGVLLDRLKSGRGLDKRKRKEIESRVEELVGVLDGLQDEYDRLGEKIGDVEGKIGRMETRALSFGVRELAFIEQECELLVSGFVHEMKHGTLERTEESPATRLSKYDIEKDLEGAQKEYLKQMILPSLVDVDDQGIPFEGSSTDFSMRIKRALDESEVLQRRLEDDIRKDMKKFGEEKRFVVETPEEEVIKGYPEVELKWMFGNKEIVVPKAIRILLFNGWKKWREKEKADLKRKLLENADLGREYMMRRQERIILDRDRIVSRTVFNKVKDRWEMDPIAVPFAVSKELVEYARIRHDWSEMFVRLKGEDKEFRVDIKEYEMLFEDFGGFDALYLKMVASGIPTAVHVMWIPFSEWNLSVYGRLLANLATVSYRLIRSTLSMKIVSRTLEWSIPIIKNTNEDLLVKIVLPVVEFITPFWWKKPLGMTMPEELYEVEPTRYLIWKSAVQSHVESRIMDGNLWIPWLLFRAYIYWCAVTVLCQLLLFMIRNSPRLQRFGIEPVFRSVNMRKLQRVKFFIDLRKEQVKRMIQSEKRKRRRQKDPVKDIFNNMKRVKNPPIQLNQFASIGKMKKEIDEVVEFLKNPSAFQKVGARAPRGVLITGVHGTGKRSLALAIAAEAKVPMVQVRPLQLESRQGVGQSAANVRELFQTARDLAPVIIFVEDFDSFASARGQISDPKNQDHEGFINQLLVELDGFEKQVGVLLMATTEYPSRIDPALTRPGRMDRVFKLERPTSREREMILRFAARDTMDPEFVKFVDWRKVEEKTSFIPASNLKSVPMALEANALRSKFRDTDELITYCSWFAALSGVIPKWLRRSSVGRRISNMMVNYLGLTFTKEDVENLIDNMDPYGQLENGIELLNPYPEWTRETKLPYAVWAAGRGLTALLLPNFDVVEHIWLEPFSWKGMGFTKITTAKEESTLRGHVETLAYLEKKLVLCFGSYVAAQILLPLSEQNVLSHSELKQAQEIATRMVIQYGWGPSDNPTIYFRPKKKTLKTNVLGVGRAGTNHDLEIAARVQKIYDLAYDKAWEMLQKNRPVLEKIVEELLEIELLSGKALERILENNGGVREIEPFCLSKVYKDEAVYVNYLEGEGPSGNSLLGAPA